MTRTRCWSYELRGAVTNLLGDDLPVPVGISLIGKIAEKRKTHLTNTILGDSWVENQDVASREGMVAFAGYPLIVGERLVGVLGLVSRRALPANSLQAMATVADQIALGIDYKRAEIARRQVSDENQQLLVSIPSILISIKPNGQISKWNRAAEEAFGIASSSAVGKQFQELPIGWDGAQIHGGIQECLSSLKSIDFNDFPFKRGDGRPGVLSINFNPIVAKDLSIRGVLMLCTEITDRRSLEAQLAHAQKLESIGQLAAGIAHEINTPIQYVGDNITFFAMPLPAFWMSSPSKRKWLAIHKTNPRYQPSLLRSRRPCPRRMSAT